MKEIELQKLEDERITFLKSNLLKIEEAQKVGDVMKWCKLMEEYATYESNYSSNVLKIKLSIK